MVCQQHDDEVEAGLEHLHALYQVMRHDRREPGQLSELKFGLECGVLMGCPVLRPTHYWDVSLTM